MDIFLICITSFAASVLTFFSGFGLGKLLMPVVALFLPVPLAIAITALVHFLSKIFKLLLLWKKVDVKVLIAFGVPAFIAAIPGAMLLERLSALEPVASYRLWGNEHYILPVKLAAGVLLILFTIAEQVPFLKSKLFQKIGISGGGALSGFFGGLTGHQGAFRSAFLVQDNLSESAFVATNAAIAAIVDAVRLAIYGVGFHSLLIQAHISLVICATFASFLGIMLGAKLLTKVTIKFIQTLVGGLMYFFGVLMIAGF